MKVIFDSHFSKQLNKLDKPLRERVEKQIDKIILDPETGKPMRNLRKGTREVYVNPFRLSYIYTGDNIIFNEIYHKDYQ